MKMLSLTQPWATLWVMGYKIHETRSWPTSYRGPLGVHASKGFPGWAKRLLEEEPFLTALNCPPDELPTGAVIGVVDLVNCIPTNSPRLGVISEPDHCFGDFSPGRFAWRAENRRLLKPIPCKGALGLWTPPPEVKTQILAALEGQV